MTTDTPQPCSLCGSTNVTPGEHADICDDCGSIGHRRTDAQRWNTDEVQVVRLRTLDEMPVPDWRQAAEEEHAMRLDAEARLAAAQHTNTRLRAMLESFILAPAFLEALATDDETENIRTMVEFLDSLRHDAVRLLQETESTDAR